MQKALITGITGQDGSLLADWLLNKGYQVFGMARQDSWLKPNLVSHLSDKISILFGDISNAFDIATAIRDIAPHEIYNLASQSRPGESWSRAPETVIVNGVGAINLFEAVRKECPKAKVYHASSSEMFGRTLVSPQNEDTSFDPVNPYAAAKVYAHHMARIYRESYGLFIACGILFNHESERRPLHFVTQKIAYGAACAALGILDSPDTNERGFPIVSQGKLALGNLDIARDWGYASDFVRAMWLMLQQNEPHDIVIGTGQLHTLKELCDIAYRCVDKDWREHVISDAAFVRPLETHQTVADSSKAERMLGWRPHVNFHDMVKKMVRFQMKRLVACLQLEN